MGRAYRYKFYPWATENEEQVRTAYDKYVKRFQKFRFTVLTFERWCESVGYEEVG